MKKMNKRISPKMSLRFRFFAICMAEYIIVVVLSYIIGWTFKKWLDITIEIPIFVWAIVFSAVSYTHLDVYKRQDRKRMPCRLL